MNLQNHPDEYVLLDWGSSAWQMILVRSLMSPYYWRFDFGQGLQDRQFFDNPFQYVTFAALNQGPVFLFWLVPTDISKFTGTSLWSDQGGLKLRGIKFHFGCSNFNCSNQEHPLSVVWLSTFELVFGSTRNQCWKCNVTTPKAIKIWVKIKVWGLSCFDLLLNV